MIEENNSLNCGKDPCLVCGKLTSGLHFEMTICRACAMFARRSFKARKQYKCQKGTGNCHVSSSAKICRYCRFRRCKELGITCKTVDKEAAIRLEPAVSPPTDDPLESTYHGGASSLKNNEAVNFDVNCDQLIANVKLKLSQPPPDAAPAHFVSPVLEMEHAYKRTLLAFVPNINELKFTEKWTKAKIQFACLTYHEKFLIFRTVWMKIHVLERMYASIRLFGNDPLDNRMLHGKNRAVDVNHVHFQWKDVAEEKLAKVEEFCKPMIERLVSTVLLPMKAINLTEFTQLLEDVAGISEETKNCADEVLDHASNDLHNYYTYEMRMPGYAMRLARLLKLQSLIEKHIQTSKEFIIMGRIFSVFECDFYNSELMD
ncbi:Nuclear hormone receptor [Aphelenchoides avenae]|nr:Nuclear hormone receptor [Aphelenchus avenae]